MNSRYPQIRLRASSGYRMISDGVDMTFYMKHPHEESAPAALRALKVYLLAAGEKAFDIYADEQGDWQTLEASAEEYIQQELLTDRHSIFHLTHSSSAGNGYYFQYHGKYADTLSSGQDSDAVSAVSFGMPTEYLEDQGPDHVQRLAMDISAQLPYCSGHAGLALNCDTSLLGCLQALRALCFRYPGMDIPEVHSTSWRIGYRLRSPSWLTFLGQPVLDSLGGVEHLRAQLRSPDTTVQELGPGRAVITLGPWPEAGDLEQGQTLPAYRELARVIEPLLFHRRPLGGNYFPPEDWRRWERRFLEEPF